MERRHGARVYFLNDGVILVKQTVKSLKHSNYVIDTDRGGNQRERHVDPGNDQALAAAVRAAGNGAL